MRKMFWPVAALFAISFSTAAFAQDIDWQKVDDVLGRKAACPATSIATAFRAPISP